MYHVPFSEKKLGAVQNNISAMQHKLNTAIYCNRFGIEICSGGGGLLPCTNPLLIVLYCISDKGSSTNVIFTSQFSTN